MTTYRILGKYDVNDVPTLAVEKLIRNLQEKSYDPGFVDGFFEVSHNGDYLEVIFKRDLENDREYAEERCPGDLRSGLLKQLHAELLEGHMPPVSLEWIEDNRKAFKVVEKKLRWCISTYEPVMANTQEEAREAVETGCVDDAYQGSDQSQSQEVVYEITEVPPPAVPEQKLFCPHCGTSKQVAKDESSWPVVQTTRGGEHIPVFLHVFECDNCNGQFYLPVSKRIVREELSDEL